MRTSSTARLASAAPARPAAAIPRLPTARTASGRTAAAPMSLRRPARRAATISFRNTVERPGLLYLLPRPDRIALLQQLGESRARSLGNRVLQLLGQIGLRHVGV